jgi:hypothetical protein
MTREEGCLELVRALRPNADVILFACVPIAIVGAFTLISTLAEVVALLALVGLIAHRVDQWTRGSLSSKSTRSG